jgi:hypothetical protein
MEIAIVKGGEGRDDRCWMTLADGTTRQVAVHALHDLPHLVVESLFGINQGLWGVLARGGFSTANRTVTARDRQRRAKLVTDADLDELARDNWPTHVTAKLLTNAVANRWGEGPDTPAGVRERVRHSAGGDAALACLDRVDDQTIEAAIHGVQKLIGQWTAVNQGQTLRLRWPMTVDDVR